MKKKSCTTITLWGSNINSITLDMSAKENITTEQILNAVAKMRELNNKQRELENNILVYALIYILWDWTLANPQDVVLVNSKDMLSWLLYKWQKIGDIKRENTKDWLLYTFYPNEYAITLHYSLPSNKI